MVRSIPQASRQDILHLGHLLRRRIGKLVNWWIGGSRDFKFRQAKSANRQEIDSLQQKGLLLKARVR